MISMAFSKIFQALDISRYSGVSASSHLTPGCVACHCGRGASPKNIDVVIEPLEMAYWCLVGNGWECGNVMIMTSYCGSFPHSLHWRF